MTTIRAQLIGDNAVLARSALERLVELARKNESIDLQLSEDDLPTLGMMRLAECGGSFGFWNERGEDIYSLQDGDPVS